MDFVKERCFSERERPENDRQWLGIAFNAKSVSRETKIAKHRGGFVSETTLEHL